MLCYIPAERFYVRGGKMEILSRLNSPAMYMICGGIVLFVALICIFFMIRAYRAGKAVGIDVTKMKRAIVASATFAVLPSVGILLGVIALSGSLGTPLPWLRLSVIGALHYETQVAEAAAEIAGLPALSASYMTPEAFSTIALVMSFCIIWGMVLSIIFTPRYTSKLSGREENGSGEKKKSRFSGFGDSAMSAMFIGLVSAYIGSYIGGFVSENGLFSFRGSLVPLCVAVVAGAVMAVCIRLKEKKGLDWIDSFSVAGSMIIAMASAVFFGKVL